MVWVWCGVVVVVVWLGGAGPKGGLTTRAQVVVVWLCGCGCGEG